MSDVAYAPYRDGVDIVSMNRPKMDWHGIGYRWHCRTHLRAGSWQYSATVAKRAADQHIEAKHE